MKKQIRLLCAEADRAALQPVLDALESKGLRVSEKAPGKNDLVLAALSEAFCADAEKSEALLDLLAAGAEQILPLQLDGAPIPDAIRNALYARNIILAARRDAAHTAQRILDAVPREKSRLPLILGAAGILLLAVVGLLIWRANQAPPEESEPVMAQEIVIPAGLTEEDLANVADVIIVSDQMMFFTYDDLAAFRDDFDRDFDPRDAYLQLAYYNDQVPDGEAIAWYSRETGQELNIAPYSDLHFLAALPNLRSVTLALAEPADGALPDLAGAEKLEVVSVLSCRLDRLDWLAGAPLQCLQVLYTPVADFSALTACEKLEDLSVDLYGSAAEADFSAFAPPQLKTLWMWHAGANGELDLSALTACRHLQSVTFGDLPLRDLSALSRAGELDELELIRLQDLRDLSGLEQLPVHRLRLESCGDLRDLSAVGSLKELEDLYVGYCPGVTDYSPVAGCTALERIHIQGDANPDALRDASFLADLPQLRDIGLYSCNLYNMDFLKGVAAHQSRISLGFAGDILDYSGLAAIQNYDYLHVNPRYQQGSRGGEFSAVLPYIRDAQIDRLMLYACAGIDLSQLPDGIRELGIRYGDLPDLSGLKPYPLQRLELWDCRYLASLNGIEAVPTLFSDRGQVSIEIVGCPRLTDYAALSGSKLAHLKLVGQYALPDLGSFQTRALRLESIPELTDLQLFDALSSDRMLGLELVGLDEIRDLSPLRHLNGEYLYVPPQVADQAAELVEAGVFDSYGVAYPDGGWQPFDGAVELLSLDELDTLPSALLRRVERLCLVGDTLIDPERGDVWEEWEDGSDTPRLLFHDYATDETVPIGYGAGTITDLSVFASLTGLRELKLYAQPLESLNGIQNFGELENFTAARCPSLTDASAAFACPSLQWLNLYGCPIESIRGVQNLQNLRELNLNDTKVTDISPLTQLDTSFAAAGNGGFRLQISGTPIGDYAPLAAILVLDELNLNDVDAARFLPYLEGVELHRLSACGVFTEDGGTDANALFTDFVRSHPQLRELWIPWNRGVTDLRPLLSLEELEYVRVSFDMEEAVASLDGQDMPFVFEIEG
ncbi:MAG: leucine-rich repeat domain-containing protein [Oscillospiraceae bacterium]|nr:leucine-rich repeat domain-containing protein [Oscillospiraceae bacterium]